VPTTPTPRWTTWPGGRRTNRSSKKQFDFIHGHFFYEKYAQLFPDAAFLTCLRHPVERILSQFNHVFFEANPEDWQYRAIVEHNLDAVDFATFDGVRDAQARHLEGRAIEDYDSRWPGGSSSGQQEQAS